MKGQTYKCSYCGTYYKWERDTERPHTNEECLKILIARRDSLQEQVGEVLLAIHKLEYDMRPPVKPVRHGSLEWRKQMAETAAKVKAEDEEILAEGGSRNCYICDSPNRKGARSCRGCGAQL